MWSYRSVRRHIDGIDGGVYSGIDGGIVFISSTYVKDMAWGASDRLAVVVLVVKW